MVNITGKSIVTGVMGHPVRHSLSPLIHNYWLAEHGVDGAYIPLPLTEPEQFSDAFMQLPHLGFAGVNLTLPFKEHVVPLLASVSPEAKAIGAVNTVWFDQGKAHGTNTDAYGFIASLTAVVPAWKEEVNTAMVLGAGGASRAVVYGLLRAGVSEVLLCNRTGDKAASLAASLRKLKFGGEITTVPWDARDQALAQADLLVNSTALGMEGKAPLVLDIATIKPSAIVADIVYSPLETALLAAAKQRGCRTVDGLGMLLHQAVGGFETWYGVTPAVTDALRKIVLEG